MGDIRFAGGHLCIDLNDVEMSGNEQRELLQAVQATVVAHLARMAAGFKVVTISLAPNNGHEPKPQPEPPAPPPPPHTH